MKTTQDEMKPAEVPERATQAGEAGPKNWEWVERHVWTQRMLEALAKGVKGGVWFSLIDKIQRPKTLIQRKRQGLHGISRGYDHYRWPNAFFRIHGLFSLVEAHEALLQSSKR